MGEGKKTRLYPIYYKKIDRDGQEYAVRTKISFTSAIEAKKYCDYLNREDVYGKFLEFAFKEEIHTIIKNARELIDNQNEDSILFS